MDYFNSSDPTPHGLAPHIIQLKKEVANLTARLDQQQKELDALKPKPPSPEPELKLIEKIAIFEK
tara:strand:- start:1781 stop:1975 length:195 start_codon:yes stop_codon:yes gene_type:complete